MTRQDATPRHPRGHLAGRAALLLLAALASLTCMAQPVQEQPPTQPESNYVVGPGDTIQIFVWRNPELSVSVPVRPDGKISSPLVEDLVAIGKTPAQLARDIEARLAEYVRSPQVNVIITTAASSYSQVKVIGQVRTPSSLPFRQGMKVLDAILAAGGLTEFAAGNRAKIIRTEANGSTTQIRVRAQDLVKKGALAENRPLQPGDVLVIPEAFF